MATRPTNLVTARVVALIVAVGDPVILRYKGEDIGVEPLEAQQLLKNGFLVIDEVKVKLKQCRIRKDTVECLDGIIQERRLAA